MDLNSLVKQQKVSKQRLTLYMSRTVARKFFYYDATQVEISIHHDLRAPKSFQRPFIASQQHN